MTTYRTARLVIHLGKHNSHYALMLKTSGGRTETDRRLSWGQLPVYERPEDPRALLDLLERAVADLRRRHGAPPGAAGSGAPGGGGGRPVAGAADTIPLHLVSRDGQPVDNSDADR